MTAPLASRGDLWFADVPGDKRRPVLVLSRDPMGRLLHSVICAPITSNCPICTQRARRSTSC